MINGLDYSLIFVDTESPVTIIRSEVLVCVCDNKQPLVDEMENFQGVTRDGFEVFGITKVKLAINCLNETHPVLICPNIAHNFILENDFLTKHNCDIHSSQ